MARNVRSIFARYFVDAMSSMAMGLFSSLIIGLIMSQLSRISALSFLAPFAQIVSASSPVVGGARAAWRLPGAQERPEGALPASREPGVPATEHTIPFSAFHPG